MMMGFSGPSVGLRDGKVSWSCVGREFYSSVSKHPEQSQWPSEARTCFHGVVFFWGKKRETWTESLQPSEKILMSCKKRLLISKNWKFQYVCNWVLSIWGAWASKCCWILLSGNGEAGQYHARVTCTELLVAGRCSSELTAFTDIY